MVSRLRAERVLRSLTLFDVRKRTGVNIARLSLLERGIEKPRSSEREALAAVFEIPADELFPVEVE